MRHKNDGLTPRELKVLAGLAEAKPDKVIADELGLSLNTIKNQKTSMYHKLRLSNAELVPRVAAARWYWERENPEAAARCSQNLGVFPPR